MKPSLTVLQELSRWDYRRQQLGSLHPRDACEFTIELDRTCWLHRRADGALVARRWDTIVEQAADLDALAHWIADRRVDGLKHHGVWVILDVTTRDDSTIIEILSSLAVSTHVVRNHPFELGMPFPLWITPTGIEYFGEKWRDIEGEQ